MPIWLKKHWKMFISVIAFIGLFSGLYQDLIKPIYSELSIEEKPVSELDAHIVANDIGISLKRIKNVEQPKTLNGSVIIQARTPPIFLSNKAKIVGFEFNRDYFSNDLDGFERELKLLKVESNKVSLESEGENAIVSLTFKPLFVFPSTSCVVNGGCKEQPVGKVNVQVFYSINGREKSSVVELVVRFI